MGNNLGVRMKFLSRILSPKLHRQEAEAKTTVHRRVEITVDRETVSISAPATRPDAGMVVSRRERETDDGEWRFRQETEKFQRGEG